MCSTLQVIFCGTEPYLTIRSRARYSFIIPNTHEYDLSFRVYPLIKISSIEARSLIKTDSLFT